MTTGLIAAPDRVMSLMQFGYTESEAAFLWMAALQGGYFLRRQVAHFMDCRDGATVTRLVQRTLALEHARSSTWRQNTQLYHLFARPFYEAIREADNRNRREHALDQIKNRIMGLDFVLAHQDSRHLATEREKLDYFHEALKIDLKRLPAKRYASAKGGGTTTRYFVDKYPVFVTTAPITGSDRVLFSFVDEGLVSLSRFENYLTQYRPLLEVLPHFQLIYVVASETHFAGARAMFDRFRTAKSSASEATAAPDFQALRTYFQLRHLYEQRAFDRFDREKLIRLRNAREVFSDPKTEALYTTWTTLGDQALSAPFNSQSDKPASITGTFSTHLLRHDYSLFGTNWPR